jgi:hypothetical protein
MQRTDAVDGRRCQVSVASTAELDARNDVPINRISANLIATYQRVLVVDGHPVMAVEGDRVAGPGHLAADEVLRGVVVDVDAVRLVG